MKSEDAISLTIKRLDINQSYFTGKVEKDKKEYSINIQGNWKEKILKTPFPLNGKEKVLVRLTGPNNILVEDYLVYKGTSEWLEIDSDEILHYIADHQDQFDTLEIIS